MLAVSIYLLEGKHNNIIADLKKVGKTTHYDIFLNNFTVFFQSLTMYNLIVYIILI